MGYDLLSQTLLTTFIVLFCFYLFPPAWYTDESDVYIGVILNHAWFAVSVLIGLSKFVLLGFDSIVKGTGKVFYYAINLILYGILYAITFVKLELVYHKFSDNFGLQAVFVLWVLVGVMCLLPNAIYHTKLVFGAITKAEYDRMRVIFDVIVLFLILVWTIFSTIGTVFWEFWADDQRKIIFHTLLFLYLSLIVVLLLAFKSHEMENDGYENLKERYPFLLSVCTKTFVAAAMYAILNLIKLAVSKAPCHNANDLSDKKYFGMDVLCPNDGGMDIPHESLLASCYYILLLVHGMDLKYLVGKTMPRQIIFHAHTSVMRTRRPGAL